MFIPYDPRRLRLWLLLCAVACAAATTLALASGLRQQDPLSEARGGIAAGLMFAFLYVFARLRPRKGWGVTIEPSALLIARPLSAETISVRWDQLKSVHRSGRRRETLVLFLKNGTRVLVPRHLFAGSAPFEQVVKAIDEKAPAQFDA
jgi:hypothetical protein